MTTGRSRRAGAVIQLGRLTLEPWRQLLDSGRPVALGGKALDVLSRLAEAAGELVTKEELFESVWPGVIVEENAIQVHISAIRKALAEEAFRLVTVRGRGYRLEGAVAVDKADPPLETSIAVLPFANMTGDPDKAYLADGIAEELITTLSRSPMKVSARTSSFSYRERSVDIRVIGAELGVSRVLEGSVRYARDRVRVTVQLIDAGNGFHLWAQNFERPLHDLLALQDDLAAAISQVLQIQLARKPASATQPKAYELYLQARGLARRMSPGSLQRSVELHRRATQLDPDFARAWTGLAGTLMVAWSARLLPDVREDEARAAVAEALRLDPTAASPHAIRAALDSSAGRWLDAAAGYELASQLDPSEPLVFDSMAQNLHAPAGQLRKSRDLTRRAVELAPASPNLRLTHAYCTLLHGDLAEATEHFNIATLMGVNPERSLYQLLKLELALAAGAIDDAVQAVSTFLQLGGFERPDQFAALGIDALRGAADKEPALQALRDLIGEADEPTWRNASTLGQLLRWFTELGAVDDAFRVADRAVRHWHRQGRLDAAAFCQMWRPSMTEFRGHSRFAELATSLGLTSLWTRIGPPDFHLIKAGKLVPDP